MAKWIKITSVFLCLFLILSFGTLKSQNVAINSTGANPVTSAMLDIASTSSGILIPRMTHMQIVSISAPITGLLAYSTDTIGFYYYTGAAWVPILANSINNGGWTISGNSSTVPTNASIYNPYPGTSNFLGTSSQKDLVFATNNGAGTYERMRISSSGNVGIANIAPSSLLDIGTAGSVAGAIRLEGSASGYTIIAPSAAAGSWTMTLPSSAGTLNQILITDGLGNTSWATPSGAISSVTATPPMYVTSSTGTVVVRIEGTNSGAVLYSNGTGSNAAFNAQGTAPTDSIRQVLVSQGASTPTWNTIGGYSYFFFKGDLQTSGATGYASIGSNQTTTCFFSVLTGLFDNEGNDNTKLYMPKCRITKIAINIATNTFTTATSTAEVWVNGTHLTAYDVTIAAGTTGNVNMCVANNLNITDGQSLEIALATGTQNAKVITVSSVQVISYPLH